MVIPKYKQKTGGREIEGVIRRDRKWRLAFCTFDFEFLTEPGTVLFVCFLLLFSTKWLEM